MCRSLWKGMLSDENLVISYACIPQRSPADMSCPNKSCTSIMVEAVVGDIQIPGGCPAL